MEEILLVEKDRKIKHKSPKKVTTSNIDKNNELSKENQKIIKYLNSMKN